MYKAIVKSCMLSQFYHGLRSPLCTSKFVIYHRRFSTNTRPRGPLAQPMRILAHNGEINTLVGNMNWVKAREASKGIPLSNEGDMDDGASTFIRT